MLVGILFPTTHPLSQRNFSAVTFLSQILIREPLLCIMKPVIQMMKLLLVEDDKRITVPLTEFLTKEGFSVECADGQDPAIEKAENGSFDLVLLDICLAQGNGFAVCSYIKQRFDLPVIFLTASGDEYSVVTGLDMGADDYIIKPFEPKILISRIKANTRRIKNKDYKVLVYPDLIIEMDNYKVIYKGVAYEFPPKEIELLFFLASNPNKVFTREQLLENVWGFDYFGETRTIDVHMKRIRSKLGDDADNQAWELKTVWGVGYKFEVKQQS